MFLVAVVVVNSDLDGLEQDEMRPLCDAGNDLSSSITDDEANDSSFPFFLAITSDEQDAERFTVRNDLSFAIFSLSLRRGRRAGAWKLLIVIVLIGFASSRRSDTRVFSFQFNTVLM